MRSVLALIVLISIMANPVMAQDITTEKGKLSYAVGWNIGEDMQRNDDEFDVETIISALRDAATGKEPQVPAEEMYTLLSDLQARVRKEQAEALEKLAAENLAKGEEFLEANKSKSGIVVLPSGIQYRIIEEGDGARPNVDNTVRIHYRGSMISGREFASSFTTGVPEEVQVGNNILPGWREILPLMKTGSTWQVFLPPEMAFGRAGNRPIGPNEALMFDIKLVEIVQ